MTFTALSVVQSRIEIQVEFGSQSFREIFVVSMFQEHNLNLEARRRSLSALRSQSFTRSHRSKTLHCRTLLVHLKALSPACRFHGPSSRRCKRSCTYSSIRKAIRRYMADARRPAARKRAVPYDATRYDANQMTVWASRKVGRQRTGSWKEDKAKFQMFNYTRALELFLCL